MAQITMMGDNKKCEVEGETRNRSRGVTMVGKSLPGGRITRSRLTSKRACCAEEEQHSTQHRYTQSSYKACRQ
jgi:hypothetical protein